MSRFLHTADWQIGRLFQTLHADNAVPLAEARLSAVERLAALATAHRVDAVLVAGDVFDAQTVSERTVRRLFNALAGYRGPWLLLPGNHDAALTESVWTRAERMGVLSPNIHLLLTPEVRVFPEAGFAVLPAPLIQRHTFADTTQWFDSAETPAGLLRIGLAHGSVQGLLAEDIDAPNPIAPDRPRTARLDYLALGDWHGCKIVSPRLAYSGTPEPDRFRSAEAGQALLVEVDAPGAEPRITPLPVGQFRWAAWPVTLQVPSDLDALLARLDALGPQDVIDLSVGGATDLAGLQRLQAALARAEAQARHLQADLGALRLQPTDEDLAALQADGYLGEVLAELRQTLAAPGLDAAARETAQDALALLAAELLARPAAAGASAGEGR